jgi:hypothetical protein
MLEPPAAPKLHCVSLACRVIHEHFGKLPAVSDLQHQTGQLIQLWQQTDLVDKNSGSVVPTELDKAWWGGCHPSSCDCLLAAAAVVTQEAAAPAAPMALVVAVLSDCYTTYCCTAYLLLRCCLHTINLQLC